VALDTTSKRRSSVGLMLVAVLAPPLPDGTLAQGDRQHVAVSYSGILATAAAVLDTTIYPTRAGRVGGVQAALERRGAVRAAVDRAGGVRTG